MTKRIIKIFCIVIVLLVQLLYLSSYSSALSYGFETVDLPESQIEKIWEYVDLKKHDNFKVETNSLPIMSFDVSTSENVVLGLKNNIVLILDKNSNVLNCFEFTNDGTFYVKWHNENVLLFMSRGTIILEFSLDGEFINLIKTDTQSVNNSKLWNDIIYNTTVSTNDYNYNLKNDLGIFNLFTFRSFSQLIRSDENGGSTIIYDVNQNQLLKLISAIVLTSLFACICLLMVRSRIQGLGQSHRKTGDGSLIDNSNN